MDLREARKSLGITQAQLAKVMGKRQEHISAIETGYEGRKPTKEQNAFMRVLLFLRDNKLLGKLLDSL